MYVPDRIGASFDPSALRSAESRVADTGEQESSFQLRGVSLARPVDPVPEDYRSCETLTRQNTLDM